MATFVVHALAPIVASPRFPKLDRRIVVCAVLCACWPDLDLLTFAFQMRPPEPYAHGGAAHSLLAAAIAALVLSLVFLRPLGIGTPAWRRSLLFVFAAGASHGVLDALTAGDVGVALFWPFSNARITSPWKLLPSVQAGLDEYLGFWGILTIANELLYIIVPLALVATFVRRDVTRRRSQLLAAGWLATVLALRILAPEWVTPVLPRVLAATGTKDAGIPDEIPRADLPNGKLVTRFGDLRAAGLFDRDLALDRPPWSSSFFPAWFGAEAGRWSEPTPRLVWRTLFGFSPPTEADARALVARAASGDAEAAQRIFTLSPAEKVDLVTAHFDFPVQRQALPHSHNGKPRYWSGRCNGVATAALVEPEPFRVVDVIGVDGNHVAFHPNDVKALLAVAYYETKDTRWIGDWCQTIGFDAAATCSMNPAVLVLAATNRLGIAKTSFLIDALPTIAKQYYAVASARVRVTREPYAPDRTPREPALADKVASLVDVTIDLVTSSTTLSYARADVREDATHYARVGLVPVTFHYEATLALDRESELLGGRWTGDPPDGPDLVIINDGGPALDDHGMLVAADRISWSFVRDLARASADPVPASPTLDLRP